LTDDLTGAAGEVEGERRLVGTKVVDVEDELLGEVFGVTPDDPTYTWIDKTIFVAGNIDGDDLWQAEIPEEIWVDKGSDETAGCGVDVDWSLQTLGYEEVVDCLDVFILAVEGGAENEADADGVFVNEFDGLFGVEDEALVGAEDVLFISRERKSFEAITFSSTSK
jgi:hypothetical protein